VGSAAPGDGASQPHRHGDSHSHSHSYLGPGALAARLRFAREPAERVRAVLATRRLEGARATPLLRASLRDPHEDVRLLAYALLEDRERQGDAAIRALLAALAAAAPDRRATVHEQLADAYWELCYQGLVAGEMEAFVLSRALEHLDAATGEAPERAARWLLRGRVLLRQGRQRPRAAALEEPALRDAGAHHRSCWPRVTTCSARRRWRPGRRPARRRQQAARAAAAGARRGADVGLLQREPIPTSAAACRRGYEIISGLPG
jgi:hypothetical protein